MKRFSLSPGSSAAVTTRRAGQAFVARTAELAGDASVRAVILTGAGTAFAAGGDLAMIQARADEAAARPERARRVVGDAMRSFYRLFLAIRDLPCPTIAALNGSAVGAGLCVALACDVRIASATARLGLNFTALGLHPGMGATWTLPRLVGPAHAAELLFGSGLRSTAHPANRAAFAPQVAGACESDEAWLFDPQTSGGLLLALDPAGSDACLAAFRAAGEPPIVRIGSIVAPDPRSHSRRGHIEIVDGEQSDAAGARCEAAATIPPR